MVLANAGGASGFFSDHILHCMGERHALYPCTSVTKLPGGFDPQPAPKAQGPPLGVDGEMAVAGPSRFSRHPSNLAAITLFSLFPRMTVNRATLAALMAIYAVLGALHEEHRLLVRYGEA